MLDLKSCPFCGSERAHAIPANRKSTERLYPVVRCAGCFTGVPGKNDDFSLDCRSAVAAWNRRTLQAVGPEPATWEYFCDRSYFDMWCVRRKDAPKVFGDGYHVMSEAEAKSLAAYLNSALVATPPAETVVEALEIARGYILRSNNHWKDDDLAKVNAALAAKPAVKDDDRVQGWLTTVTEWIEGGCSSWGLPVDEIRLIVAALAAKDGRS